MKTGSMPFTQAIQQQFKTISPQFGALPDHQKSVLDGANDSFQAKKAQIKAYQEMKTLSFNQLVNIIEEEARPSKVKTDKDMSIIQEFQADFDALEKELGEAEEGATEDAKNEPDEPYSVKRPANPSQRFLMAEKLLADKVKATVAENSELTKSNFEAAANTIEVSLARLIKSDFLFDHDDIITPLVDAVKKISAVNILELPD